MIPRTPDAGIRGTTKDDFLISHGEKWCGTPPPPPWMEGRAAVL